MELLLITKEPPDGRVSVLQSAGLLVGLGVGRAHSCLLYKSTVGVAFDISAAAKAAQQDRCDQSERACFPKWLSVA